MMPKFQDYGLIVVVVELKNQIIFFQIFFLTIQFLQQDAPVVWW